MSKVLKKAEGISRIFVEPGHFVWALIKADINIEEGGYLALLGPSGAGKSTLLHILGGLDKPTAGSVFFKGRDIYSLPNSEKSRFLNRETGFIFQFYHLLPELTVMENVVLPLLISGVSHRKAVIQAEPVIEELGIAARKDFYPSQISGGEKQRAALARALINRPAVLFCDEPTGNLDQESSGIIRQILKRINSQEKTTIIMATHNLTLAKDAKTVLNIKAGQIGCAISL